MITVRPGCVEPWATPSSAPIPSLVIALTSRTSTSTPSLRNCAGAARELDRKQHVRRLVDEFARDDHAVDDVAHRARTPFARRRHRRPRPKRRRARRRPRRPSSWSCSGRICRRAAGRPAATAAACSGFMAAIGQFRDDRHGLAAGAELAGDHAAELEKILVLDRRQLAGADHDQARGLEALRRQNIERGRRSLPLNWLVAAARFDQIGRRPQRLAGRGAEFQRVVAEHHQNAARGGGKRDEADLDGVGHRQILQKSGLSPGREPGRAVLRSLSAALHMPSRACSRRTMACPAAALPSAAVAGRPHSANY